jgi:ElaB/YqjD/DUF883 family membrane-anchored ribosome-binding protein
MMQGHLSGENCTANTTRKGAAKMNNNRSEDKVRQDAEKIKKDFGAMVGDGVSLISEGFEKLKGEAKETVGSTVTNVKEDVEHGLKQYNATAQKAAEKVPGGFSDFVARYPWVAMTAAIVIGYRVGRFLKSSR